MSETEDIESVSRNPDSLTEKELLDLYISCNKYESRVCAIASKSYGIRGWGIDDTIEASFMLFLNLLIEQPADQSGWKGADGKVRSTIAFLIMLIFGLWVAIRFKLGFYGGVFFVSAVYLVLYGLAKLIRAQATTAEWRTRNNMCRSCGYLLSGLDSVGSVTGNQLDFDLGPAVCPECGVAYPRVLDG